MQRDYVSEMNQLIDESLPEGDYVVPIFAHELVTKLAASDPDLLRGWCAARYEAILGDFIQHKVKNRRSASLEQRSRSMFAGAAEKFAGSGDVQALRESVPNPFRQTYVVNGDNLRRRVCDMTGADHRFVAAEYAASAQTAKLLEAFHRAVAKKVGPKRTGDVFTEETYLAMYRSVTRQAA